MPTLTTKALVLGLSSILGGTGVALGSEHLVASTSDVSFAESFGLESEASEDLSETETSETDAAEESRSERALAAHARRDARAEARKTAHAERASLREARREARAAIRGDRPAPGEGRRGMTPEAREAMRELAPGHARSAARRNGNAARRGPPAGRGMSTR